MISKSFSRANKDLVRILNDLMGRKQTGQLEKQAQLMVDEYFRLREVRNTPIVIEGAALHIIGCKLAFDIGRIQLGEWRTAFAFDLYSVAGTERGAIALGYVNGYQLYILPVSGQPPKLMARNGMAPHFLSWCPALAGAPEVNSVFHVALARAAYLGYSTMLSNMSEVPEPAPVETILTLESTFNQKVS